VVGVGLCVLVAVGIWRVGLRIELAIVIVRLEVARVVGVGLGGPMRIPIAAVFAAAGTSCPGWDSLSRSGSESDGTSRSGMNDTPGTPHHVHASSSGSVPQWDSGSGSNSDAWSTSGSEDVAWSEQ
jgi:hypothetical protein